MFAIPFFSRLDSSFLLCDILKPVGFHIEGIHGLYCAFFTAPFVLLLLIPDSILAVNGTVGFTHLVDAHDMKLTTRFIVIIIHRRKQVRQLAKLNSNLEEQTCQALFCTIDLRFHCFGNHRRDIVEIILLTQIADIKQYSLFNELTCYIILVRIKCVK